MLKPASAILNAIHTKLGYMKMVLEQIKIGYFLRISAKIIILFVVLQVLQNLFLWDCRKKQILPNMYGFRAKIIFKYTTGRIISNKEFFMRKWMLTP